MQGPAIAKIEASDGGFFSQGCKTWVRRVTNMALEERISRLEGAYEQVDRRLDDLSRAIEGLRTDLKGSLR